MHGSHSLFFFDETGRAQFRVGVRKGFSAINAAEPEGTAN